MRSSTLIPFAAALLSASTSLCQLVSAAASSSPAGQGVVAAAPAPLRSRHAQRDTINARAAAQSQSSAKQHSSLKKKRGTCKSKTSKNNNTGSNTGTIGDKVNGNTGSGSSSSSNNNNSNNTGSGLGSGADLGSEYLKYGNIYVGFLPDDGSGGGQAMSMKDINKMLPRKSAYYGRYAQVSNGKRFDGSQIRSVMNDVVESGGVLQASIMPYGTWYGLTESDNSNAVAIAQFCKEMTDTHGVEIWLRFAHEMNWYQVDGTYSGGVSDFMTGWKVVSKAIDEISPTTKMYWSPNFESNIEGYKKYFPTEGKVDIVGFDWYPKSAGDINFLKYAKEFHDTFTDDNTKMVQGETGLQYHASDAEKMEWVRQLSSQETQDAMPNYIGWCWFNYQKYENGKDLNFKIVEPNQGAGDGINQQFVSFISV